MTITTTIKLNLLPLGSYDILIGIYWITTHMMKLNCYDKVLECLNNEGDPITLQGMKSPITCIMISVVQVKHCRRKGCSLYAIQIIEEKGTNTYPFENDPNLSQYSDVFPGLLPS